MEGNYQPPGGTCTWWYLVHVNKTSSSTCLINTGQAAVDVGQQITYSWEDGHFHSQEFKGGEDGCFHCQEQTY